MRVTGLVPPTASDAMGSTLGEPGEEHHFLWGW